MISGDMAMAFDGSLSSADSRVPDVGMWTLRHLGSRQAADFDGHRAKPPHSLYTMARERISSLPADDVDTLTLAPRKF